MTAAIRHTRFAVAAAVLFGVLAIAGAAVSSPAAEMESVRESSVLPGQIWAIGVGSKSFPRLTPAALRRARAGGINAVVATDLTPKQLVRLRAMSARQRLRVLTPAPGGRCTGQVAVCVLVAKSMAGARRLSRNPAVDLVVVERPGPAAVRAQWTGRGRVIFLTRLGSDNYDGIAWRRAIERAADASDVDLAVEPGRFDEPALASYLSTLTTTLPRGDRHFPIAVWFESVLTQADVARDRDVGLNTYIVLTANSNLALVRGRGMKAFVQASQRSQFAPQPHTETAAWELHDEIDMQMSPDAGYAELLRIKSALPSDGRARYNNYGKGVMFWETDAEAARYVNAVDLVSNDIYWFTDPDVCGVSEGGALFLGGAAALDDATCRRAANYGSTVERMRRLVAPVGSRPVWAFVEVGQPFAANSDSGITADEVRAAVWHSLIAGANGIIYFNHSFGGPCHSQHVLRDPCYAGIRSTVKAVNAQIRSLARVLNAPTVSSGWRQGPGTKALVKWEGGHFYLFAGSAEVAGASGTFAIPCVGSATATVLGENRRIAVNGGSFSDTFADGNAIHIYRIDGGKTCGRAIP